MLTSAALLQAPLARAYLAVMRESGLAVDEVLQPELGLRLVAVAADEITPYRADHAEISAWLATRAPQLEQLADAIVRHPMSAWWQSPTSACRQVWLSQDGKPPTPDAFIGQGPKTWELDHLPEKCVTALFTCSEIGGITAVLAALVEGVGEYPVEQGARCWSLTPSAGARVFEIRHAQDWRDLCHAYPKPRALGQIYPDWDLVAGDWDGVHLTVSGLLLTQQLEMGDGVGSLADWDMEQTMWLRWVFVEAEPWIPGSFRPDVDWRRPRWWL